MEADVGIGICQGIDKTERSLFTKVIADNVLYILTGKGSRNDGLTLHPRALRTLARRDSK